VLSTPPAFVLSQDQTLQQGKKNPAKKTSPTPQAMHQHPVTWHFEVPAGVVHEPVPRWGRFLDISTEQAGFGGLGVGVWF
jgi:hypothetical protein